MNNILKIVLKFSSSGKNCPPLISSLVDSSSRFEHVVGLRTVVFRGGGGGKYLGGLSIFLFESLFNAFDFF